ncbi:extracellular solute-binding protein [Nakamurella flavida]|uniref:Extracellular solute-binding protein n=1 Tax=Nakamurella flavida TaxID=363630 RepID=A0A938YNN3_9ACTN|nr:extracellular solute-binding protein [Nakamurella flavida]MBM9477881.1 extracellular solute-binding protein [Nakamurella flavida]MDP9778405.1 ABC-type glycerol-3-phosphate transport system substrate-binding protein [Nakamurella flavida]
MLASWVDQGFITDVMQNSAAASIGATLKIVTVDDGTYPAQASAAQKAGQAPDLIFWTAQGATALLASGVNLAPLDQYVASEDKAAFYEQDYQANTIDGKIMGLGFRCNCRGIVYHGDYAKAAGLTVPTTWSFDEFGQFAKALNVDDHIGFGFEAKTGDGRSSSNFLPLIWSTGASLVKGAPGSWEVGFTQDQMAQVMQFYYDSVHTWQSTPAEVGTWGYEQTDGNFAKGLLASYSAGPFVYPQSKSYPQTLENLALAPLPNAGTPATFWEEHTLFIQGEGKQQDLAWKFIEAMRSEETQELIANRTGDAQLAVRKASNSSITDPFIKGFGDLLPTAVVPEPVAIAPIMNNAVLPAIQAVTLSDTPPADAAAALITAMQGELQTINSAG